MKNDRLELKNNCLGSISEIEIYLDLRLKTKWNKMKKYSSKMKNTWQWVKLRNFNNVTFVIKNKRHETKKYISKLKISGNNLMPEIWIVLYWRLKT